MPASEFDLEVLLVFLGVRRLNLHVLELLAVVELVERNRLGLVQGNTLLRQEFPGEWITRDDTEDVLAEVHVDADVEVLPGIVVVGAEFL